MALGGDVAQRGTVATGFSLEDVERMPRLAGRVGFFCVVRQTFWMGHAPL